ncbi:hypothetical protein DXZ20_09630 [Leptolyngbyaceae cyanobacterium CCMR0081]|uniref:Uncharacterized protein n=1 Tax=Adonisia turfae CCMR0081 TaxID=2292702 RepID=A0A6M0RI60_9CYAN|nr:hypothetical protein [Adonisia turfae CCMR0081]
MVGCLIPFLGKSMQRMLLRFPLGRGAQRAVWVKSASNNVYRQKDLNLSSHNNSFKKQKD